MSKRTKFLFVTWLGPNVGTMKRARLSSDKALIKEVIMVGAIKFNSQFNQRRVLAGVEIGSIRCVIKFHLTGLIYLI